jgi:Zn-finger protein
MSSGQYLQTFNVQAVCGHCPFAGLVEARFDPEVDSHSYVWGCPECEWLEEAQF